MTIIVLLVSSYYYRYYHQCVGEGHGPPLGVREPPVVQQLEHHVEDVGVGLWL